MANAEGAAAAHSEGETLSSDSDSMPTLVVDGEAAGKMGVTVEQGGRYVFEREFGRGGQAVVLLAYDSHIGRQVAFKQLLPERRAAAEEGGRLRHMEARFLREARVTGQLEHPGIVPVYEVGSRPDGGLYYTQKLVRGRELAAVLRECSDLSARLRLLPSFLAVCQAVAYAHRRGVIHRDLKPSNIMLGELGEAVVLDWGLAKTRHDVPATPAESAVDSMLETDAGRTRAGSVMGTPAYMSPEQAVNAASVDERTDVWSLGVILFEMLTGRRAFDGKTSDEVLRQVATARIPAPRSVCPQAPAELSAVAERALSRDPALRYRDAAGLAADVEAWSTGARVAAYDYSAWQLALRFARRNKLALAVALVAAATALYGTANFVKLQITRAGATDRKAALDDRIRKLELAIHAEGDLTKLSPMADELSSVARDAAQVTAALRAMGARLPPLPPVEQAIHLVLQQFGADTYAIPPSFVERVAFHLELLAKRPNTPAVYRRKSEVWPIIEREFATYRLPIEMGYVAWAESQFNPQAESSGGARGMWQFMAPTARAFGLRVDDQIDERFDPEKSTRAAARYLTALIAEFGGAESFLLVLASYNKGEHGIRRVLREVAFEPGGWRRERRELWHLYRLRKLPQETIEYVPQILAPIIANADPKKYGLEQP